MSKYKLVAVDLDGTLLNSQRQLSRRTIETIRRVQQRGVYVTFATGRMYRSALPFAQQLNIDVPLIAYQGALVKNLLTGEILSHHTIPLELAQQVMLYLQEADYHINLYLDDDLFVAESNAVAERYARNCLVDLNVVGDLLAFMDRPPTKILAIDSADRISQLERQLNQQYAADIMHLCTSKSNFLEISNPQATKGHALDMLAQMYNVHRHEVMVFGDSCNDLEMLDYAGWAVVMDNAQDDIKKNADYIAPSNDQDGVAVVLEKMILKD